MKNRFFFKKSSFFLINNEYILIFLYKSQKKGKSCEEFDFEYNSREIKPSSWKSLKELGMPNVVQIKVISSIKNPNKNNLNNVKHLYIFSLWR